jgi:predicted transcriptional regulator
MNQEILAPSIGMDHPTVKSVIKIANEILNEGRLLNIEYLYRRAKRELKIPREGLLTIIQYLVNKKILINGSKFTRDTILENDIRNLVYNYIQQNIGLHFSAIKRDLVKFLKGSQIGVGQLIWHLEMLLKFNLIKSFELGNHTIFIPVEMDETIAKIYYLARNLVRNKILRHLNEIERSTRPQIAEGIQETRENVYYHIKILIEQDCIVNINKEVYLNPKLKQQIIDVIRYLSVKQELEYKEK